MRAFGAHDFALIPKEQIIALAFTCVLSQINMAAFRLWDPIAQTFFNSYACVFEEENFGIQ